MSTTRNEIKNIIIKDILIVEFFVLMIQLLIGQYISETLNYTNKNVYVFFMKGFIEIGSFAAVFIVSLLYFRNKDHIFRKYRDKSIFFKTFLIDALVVAFCLDLVIRLIIHLVYQRKLVLGSSLLYYSPAKFMYALFSILFLAIIMGHMAIKYKNKIFRISVVVLLFLEAFVFDILGLHLRILTGMFSLSYMIRYGYIYLIISIIYLYFHRKDFINETNSRIG